MAVVYYGGSNIPGRLPVYQMNNEIAIANRKAESAMAREFVNEITQGQKPWSVHRVVWEGEWRMRGIPGGRIMMRPISIQFAAMQEVHDSTGRWLSPQWGNCSQCVTLWQRTDGRLFPCADDARK